jgi:hypothetical protein
VTCSTAAGCDDHDPCTTDVCGQDGSCQHSAIPGCQRCASTGECSDGNDCTTDACTNDACVHTAIADCNVCVPHTELCGDGVDNDCDGVTDCADPNCGAAPNCAPVRAVEICGDCTDNDGDGLVDYEDDDCCAAPMLFRLKHLQVSPASLKVPGDRLRLDGVYAPFRPDTFNPLARDTSIQVSGGHGQVFCVSIPARHWQFRRPRTFGFRDRTGSFAAGLSEGHFTITRNRSITFSTRGRRARVGSMDVGQVTVTIGSGDQCSQAKTPIFRQRAGFMFP